ncbi:Transposon Tf2-11 polyprotein [Thelohanellus kitauei]|uniref:Transposon Tf2-11 polyprotein n=1 Tax=Thelohanellus kitauei TaxID=669202 RepID=A0A0C2IWF9_THEKT|nr:Transposon Tf2-11 polyprotein [Thelohanellus kitauei]
MRLEQCGLTIQVSKCTFLEDKIKYLGHVIDKNGIFRTTESIEPIMNCPKPTNTKELESFLGAINYYSNLVPMIHAGCTKFNELTRNGKKWEYNDEHKKIFEEMKNASTTHEYLYHYNSSIHLFLRTNTS